MKFKFTVPYILAGVSLFAPSACAQSNTNGTAKMVSTENSTQFHDVDLAMADSRRLEDMFQNDFYEMMLDIKASELRDRYVENMLGAQKRLNPLLGKRGYRAAVRRELPGAPVGQHCVYGQYTQLGRALDEMGDTIEIVPSIARTACAQFIKSMRQEYGTVDRCIYEGRMHANDSAYNAALEKFLASRAARGDTARVKNTAEFAKKNFSADNVEAGAMAIVPRRPGSHKKHMVMVVGRGRVENGIFIPDEKGQIIYAGHNRETMGNMMRTYDMSNVFVANTREIARHKYGQELSQFNKKTKEELITFLGVPANERAKYINVSHDKLIQLARKKYFQEKQPIIAMANTGRVRG